MADANNAQGPQLAPAQVQMPAQRKRGSRIPTLVWLLLLVAAACGGCYVGREYLHDPVDFGTLTGDQTISDAQLDKVMATYVIGDEVFEVTARDALAQQISLDAARTSDGSSYTTPSAESAIAAARTAILMREVDERGITVSDEDITAYMQEHFGTEDMANMAASFTMDETAMRERLRESAALSKLRAQVVDDPGDVPQPPAAPEEGKESTATADYASYIFALAGDEWDSDANAWATSEGRYATALHDYDIKNDAATYAAASTAYDVAYQLHSDRVTAASKQWTEFVNSKLSNAKFAVSTLVS